MIPRFLGLKQVLRVNIQLRQKEVLNLLRKMEEAQVRPKKKKASNKLSTLR